MKTSCEEKLKIHRKKKKCMHKLVEKGVEKVK